MIYDLPKSAGRQRETIEHGRRIYSLELGELNKASLRWMVNDDGTLTPENKPSTGSPTDIVTQDQEKVKSSFTTFRNQQVVKANF